MRIGSLCSGYGGLDLATEEVFGAKPGWFCDNASPASAVLAQRFDSVPNHGDIQTIDWTQIEPVEIITAGYPCQPFSDAGQRRGTADERHLWPTIFRAISQLRPAVVVLENVAGHLWRGFDMVLADLASIRFDAQWTTVQAARVGAPHLRGRLFVVAYRYGSVPYAARLGRDQRSGLRADRPDDPTEIGQLFAGDSSNDSGVQWNGYSSAVDRWSRTIGRRPARPMVRGPGGGLIPSARFVEWMMGLPDGWVTDVQGLAYEDQMELLGNGVVPQQAEAALDELLGRLA